MATRPHCPCQWVWLERVKRLPPLGRAARRRWRLLELSIREDRPITRINVVPPSELNVKHLVAEYRELPRIFAYVKRAVDNGHTVATVSCPRQYTLGTGHCRFFYKRLGWLARRQQALIDEMLRRGYKPTFLDAASLLDGIPEEWHGDWTPTRQAKHINRLRIAERGGKPYTVSVFCVPKSE